MQQARKSRHLSLRQQALILVAVPLAFELVLLGSVYQLLQKAEHETYLAEHAKSVIAKTTETEELLFNAGIAFIAYDAVTKPMFAQRLNDVLRKIPKELDELEKLVADNPRYVDIVHFVQRESSEAVARIEIDKREAEAGARLNMFEAMNLKEKLHRCIEQLVVIRRSEKATQVSPATGKKLKALVNYLILFGVFMSVLIALALAAIFHSKTSKRLDVLMNNSVKLGLREPLTPVLDGADEIAHLDQAFHSAAIAIDEFARKERAFVENAADVICSIDGADIFSNVSPASKTLWASAPEQLIGRCWLDFIVEEDKERSIQWAKSIRNGETEASLENKFLRPDGKVIDLLWSGHWSEIEQLYFCVAHDITARRELERFKQEFAAMVSHDLRTPLAAVQSTLAVLGRGAWGQLNERGLQKVATAETNITRSIEMINTLLDLEKLETGRFELTVQQSSGLQLLKRCTEAVTSLAERKYIKINLPNDDVNLMVDPDRILQVGINLLGNAIKFSPEQSSITIAFVPESDFVRVEVRDEGPGIPADQHEFIFDRYRQLDGDAQAKKEGSGLGLAICKSIIEAHGGTIGVADNEPKGSIFWFCIPAGKNQLSDDSLYSMAAE